MEALLRVMHEFLLFHVKAGQDESADKSSSVAAGVSMFYVNSVTTAFEHKQDGAIQADQKPSVISEIAGASTMAPPRRGSNPDVNDIIVKIEMKKFQNLIENRIKHKNNLLQADMKRVYPLTKKTKGGMTLYDQHLIMPSPKKRRRLRTVPQNIEGELTVGQSGAPLEATEGGYSSAEDQLSAPGAGAAQ